MRLNDALGREAIIWRFRGDVGFGVISRISKLRHHLKYAQLEQQPRCLYGAGRIGL